jgi:hypothetical protein
MNLYRDFRNGLEEIMKMSGEVFEIDHEGEIHTAKGMRHSKENYIAFVPVHAPLIGLGVTDHSA